VRHYHPHKKPNKSPPFHSFFIYFVCLPIIPIQYTHQRKEMLPSQIPLAVLTDSYKTTHPFIYPKAQRMVAYGEMRQAYDKDPNDNRIVFYGIRYM